MGSLVPMMPIFPPYPPSPGGQPNVTRVRLDFRTWFGLRGGALVGADDRHDVWTGRVRMTHYGLVNHFLRHRLPEDERLRVIALHERGHFETLPAAAGLAAVLLLLGKSRPGRRASARVTADWMAHHAVWEGLAEAWLVAHEGRRYQAAVWWRTAVFWSLVLGAGAWLMRRPGGRRRSG